MSRYCLALHTFTVWTLDDTHLFKIGTGRKSFIAVTLLLSSMHAMTLLLHFGPAHKAGHQVMLGVRRPTWSLALIRGNHADIILFKRCSSHILSSLDCQSCAADKRLQAYTASYNLLFKQHIAFKSSHSYFQTLPSTCCKLRKARVYYA